MSRTTIIGAIISVLSATQVNLIAAYRGDTNEINKLINALLIGALGYFAADTNKDKELLPSEKQQQQSEAQEEMEKLKNE